MKKNFWMCKANLGAEGRSCRFFHACISNLIVPLLLHCSVLVQHLIEGVIELPRDRVDLELLPDDLVLQLVDPDKVCIGMDVGQYLFCDIFFALLHIIIDKEVVPVVQLADVHLCILGP